MCCSSRDASTISVFNGIQLLSLLKNVSFIKIGFKKVVKDYMYYSQYIHYIYIYFCIDCVENRMENRMKENISVKRTFYEEVLFYDPQKVFSKSENATLNFCYS